VTTLTMPMPVQTAVVRGLHVKRPSRASRLWSKSATTLVLLIFFDLTVATRHLLVGSRLCALALVILLPGLTIVGATRIRLDSRVTQLALVVGAGAFALMLWAAASSAVLPRLGVPRPLETWPLTFAVDGICLLALLACPAGTDPILLLFDGRRSRTTLAFVAVGCLLPLAGVAGTERLNGGRGSALTLVVWIAVFLLLAALLCALSRLSDSQIQIALFSASVTLIYLFSYRSNQLFGFDIQQEFQRFSTTFAAGRWTPPTNGDPYAAMLSITALPTFLAKVSGISGLYIFKGVFPLFLAWIPPLTYRFARRWFSALPSAVSAIYLIMLAQFAAELSGISRQEVGLFYFAVFLLVLFDSNLNERRRTIVAAATLAALAVSHYSTFYTAVSLLVVTCIAYGFVRLVSRRRRRHPAPKPFISLFFITLTGVELLFIWDIGVTSSARNLTSFLHSMIDQGPSILPDSKGSLLTRWLNGNVTPKISPANYYRAALEASKRQSWLHPYPLSITSHYPASAAPAIKGTGLGLDGLANGLESIGTVLGELFLLVVIIGTVFMLLRNRKTPVPLEVVILCATTLAFLAAIRVSGTFGQAYNQDRAQIQAGMILCISLALGVSWFAKRSPRLTTATAIVSLLVLGATVPAGSSGLAAQLGPGGSPLLENGGTSYDVDYMTQQEVAASKWLVNTAGRKPVIYTDEFGELRIWAGSTYTAATQTLLTPATIAQGSWVFATGYNLSGTAYGMVNNDVATYRFPSAFLNRVDSTVYSSPGARVYR
jgi:uncharacterized membrane protein